MCESGEREGVERWSREQSSWVTASPSPPHVHVPRAGLAHAFLHGRSQLCCSLARDGFESFELASNFDPTPEVTLA